MRSSAEARRLGQIGGFVVSRARVGDSAWGVSMFRRRAALAMHRHYPQLSRTWALNASRARRGLPPLPVREIPDELLRPGSRITRERRRLARARREYDRQQAEQWRRLMGG